MELITTRIVLEAVYGIDEGVLICRLANEEDDTSMLDVRYKPDINYGVEFYLAGTEVANNDDDDFISRFILGTYEVHKDAIKDITNDINNGSMRFDSNDVSHLLSIIEG